MIRPILEDIGPTSTIGRNGLADPSRCDRAIRVQPRGGRRLQIIAGSQHPSRMNLTERVIEQARISLLAGPGIWRDFVNGQKIGSVLRCTDVDYLIANINLLPPSESRLIKRRISKDPEVDFLSAGNLQ
jgi:hypothetical protein